MGRPILCRLFFVKIHLFSWILLAFLACSSIVRGEGPLFKTSINNTVPVESSNDYLLITSLAVNGSLTNLTSCPVWSLQVHEIPTRDINTCTPSWKNAGAAFLPAHTVENPFFSSYPAGDYSMTYALTYDSGAHSSEKNIIHEVDAAPFFWFLFFQHLQLKRTKYQMENVANDIYKLICPFCFGDRSSKTGL